MVLQHNSSIQKDLCQPLDVTGTITVNELIGVLLYYAYINISTIHITMGTNGSQQAKTTKNTAVTYLRILQYIAVHPNLTVRFDASDVILHIHSAISYPSYTFGRSPVRWYISLPSCPQNSCSKSSSPNHLLPINRVVLILSVIMMNILPLVEEAILGALFLTAKDTTLFCKTISNLSHP